VRAVTDQARGSERRALLQRLQHHGDLTIRGRAQALEVWTCRGDLDAAPSGQPATGRS
jgi:hypothetical protein